MSLASPKAVSPLAPAAVSTLAERDIPADRHTTLRDALPPTGAFWLLSRPQMLDEMQCGFLHSLTHIEAVRIESLHPGVEV